MALVSLLVGTVVKDYGKYDKKYVWHPKIKCDWSHVDNEDDTYFLIFSSSQEHLLKAFMRNRTVKVLYKSPKAVNKTNGHGTLPRNTLVVFERKSRVPKKDKPVPTM